MITLDELIALAIERNASDLHITVGKPPILRLDGDLVEVENIPPLSPQQANALILPIIPERRKDTFHEYGDIDFAYVSHRNRMRVNIFKQRGSCALALRILARRVPTLEEMNLPQILKQLAMLQRGLVLVTGPTGSGKSTTLAALIDYVNTVRACHVITIEDPIEYLHSHKRSVINQRELNEDTIGFAPALRAALREDPDIILVGEMRDLDTIKAALTAAETGHLVFSTLHTMGAAKTIDRIVDVFPPNQQQQIRIQLAETLQAVVSQQLVPLVGRNGRVAAMEIMLRTDAIGNLIREGKTHQIDSFIQTGRQHGMQPMDADLARLVRLGEISLAIAQQKSINPRELGRYM